MGKERAVGVVGLAAALVLAIAVGTAAGPGVEAVTVQRSGKGRDGVSRADAQHMREKAMAIEARGALLERPGDGNQAAAATTVVTEREVNSYLAFDAASQIPVGVVGPRISIVGGGRLSGTALVDLDAVRLHRKSNGWLDPLSYLTGQLPVSLSGRLSADGGAARFELESATISGVPIPRSVVQELVSFYTRTPANPRGLSLDDPFPLPARIHRIDIRPGEALVVQQ